MGANQVSHFGLGSELVKRYLTELIACVKDTQEGEYSIT